MQRLNRSLFVLCSLLVASATLDAQTANTAIVSGAVTDSTGGVVPGAQVELLDTGTGVRRSQTSNDAGQYVFPNISPGRYKVTVIKAGFRGTTVSDLKVEVAKSYVQDFRLEVGAIEQAVEVVAGARVELQTADATVGNVLASQSLLLLPTFTRQANELLILQPGWTPGKPGSPTNFGVTGAMRDQTTTSLDGLDITNNWGDNGTFIYLGVEGVEEFRVAVANPNATFGHGGGGQMSVVGRRGSNDFHGAAFYYMQNSALNANSWDNNRARLLKPPLKDNRFGVRFGGSVKRDKTFFFVNYDGRRFPQALGFSRLVPTDTLRQGTLRFRDAAGNINSYPLATSTACGPQGASACDPRGLGLSPTMAKLWSVTPSGNDPSLGDGLNTIGYRGSAKAPINNGFFFGRIDHYLNNNWRIDISDRYYRELQRDARQLSIVNGNPTAVTTLPVRQNMDNIGISGAFRPNLTGEFRFGRIRYRNAQDSLRPLQSATQLAIPGTNTAAGYISLAPTSLGSILVDPPIDNNTRFARKKFWDNRVYQWNADLNWIKGSHNFQFGAHLHYLPTRQLSDDKAVGALGSVVAQIDSDFGAVQLPSAIEPRPCGGAVTTNCLPASQAQQWNRLYASALGIVNSTTVLMVRDGNLKPLPFGSLLESDTTGIWAPSFYWQDVWRLRPSLTLTLGANYSWQTAPVEKNGLYTLTINADTGELITTQAYLNARKQAAAKGQIYNPTFGFLPINSAHRPLFDTDWGSIAPRTSLAWNPSPKGGLFGRLMGDRKTVIRGGFSLLYDRENTVQSVLIPSLSAGFSQTISANAPPCNSTSGGGAGCDPNSANQAASVFRVGQDGSIPLPVVPQVGNPVVPFWCRTGSVSCLFPDSISVGIDPSIKSSRNYVTSLTVQRELPKEMLVELAFVGRYARRLPITMGLTNSPYMQLDSASGQTFAQAFDNVATALRTGATVAPQPWFQNQVPMGSVALAAAARSNFINGNVSSVFQTLDLNRMSMGLTPFNNYMAQTVALRDGIGFSNYSGLLVTVRKRLSPGLVFDLNYTYAKSLDAADSQAQNGAAIPINNFDLSTAYGPSMFDIRHIFNGHWHYQLPFRSAWSPLNKVIGGWYLAGVATAHGGSPLVVSESSQVWGGALLLGSTSGAIPLISPSSLGSGLHSEVTGSGGVGTNGNPAARGSGLNLFANPEAAFKSFRPILIGQDGRDGRANVLRGLPFWNLDASLGKQTRIRERVNLQFSAEFFNVFNKVNFLDPSLSLTSPQSFGVITTQLVPINRSFGSRAVQLGLRMEF